PHRQQKPRQTFLAYTSRMLLSITIIALAALGNLYTTPQVSVLGFVSTIANSAALLFAEKAVRNEQHDEKLSDSDDDSGYTLNDKPGLYREHVRIYKNISAVVALGCALSMFL